MVLPWVSESAPRAAIAHADNDNSTIAGDIPRITNKYCLIVSVTVAAILFAAAEAERKPTLQVTDAAGVEFRGKLVFILLNSLTRIL